jgi:hypothetical protein
MVPDEVRPPEPPPMDLHGAPADLAFQGRGIGLMLLELLDDGLVLVGMSSPVPPDPASGEAVFDALTCFLTR